MWAMWKIAKSSLEKQVSKIIYDLSFIDIGTYNINKPHTYTHTRQNQPNQMYEYVCVVIEGFL